MDNNLHKIIIEVGGKITSSFEQAQKKIKKVKKEVDDLNNTDVKIDVDTKGLDKTILSTAKLKDSFGDLKTKGFDKVKESADDLFGMASPLLKALGPSGWIIAGIGLVTTVGIKKLGNLADEFGKIEKQIFKLSNNKVDAEVGSQLVKSTLAQFENVSEDDLIKTGNAIAKAYGITQSEAISQLRDSLTITGGNTEGFGAIQEQAGRLKQLGLEINDVMSITNSALGQGLEPGKVLESVKESADALYNSSEDSKKLLSSIGLDQDNLVKQLRVGKMSIYDADKLIMDLTEKSNDTQLQQLIMANFFKSAGEDISLEQLKNSIKYSKSQDKIVKSAEFLNSIEKQRRDQLDQLTASQQDAAELFKGEGLSWSMLVTDLQIAGFKLMESFAPVLKILSEISKLVFKIFNEIVKVTATFFTSLYNTILFGLNGLIKAINLFKGEKDKLKEIEFLKITSDFKIPKSAKTEEETKNKNLIDVVSNLGLNGSEGLIGKNSNSNSKSSESNNSFGGSGQKSIVFNIENLLKIDNQNIANNMDLKTLEKNIINLLINSINTAQIQF